jgi:hypothetical protein
LRIIFSISALCVIGLQFRCSTKEDAQQHPQKWKSKSQAEIVKVEAEHDDDEGAQPSPSASATPESTPSSSPKTTRTRCSLPSSSNSNPANLRELLQLINSMPLPLTLPCFVDVLAHPLKLSATISNVSAQPAPDDENPRFFLFSGMESKLILSVVPSGEGAKALEYSFLVSETESVKGEILFPVEYPLDLDQLGKRLLRKDGVPGSTCGACHANERLADSSRFGADHYVSRALQPKSSSLVSQRRLNELALKCKSQASERCALFDAIFGTSGIEIQSFPAAMPTMF